MALRQLSVDCKDGDWTCPSIWDNTEMPEEGVIAVGALLDPSPVPLGSGQVAIRLSRQVVRDAGILDPNRSKQLILV